jgi:DNA-binding Xre family transcriptional regulator
MRELMRRTGLSQHTLEAILKGKAVRRATLERTLEVVRSLTQAPTR